MSEASTMWGQVAVIWGRIPTFQKAASIAFILVIIAGVAGMALWSGQPDWRQLRGELTPAEASKIMTRLDADGIAYQVMSGGRTLLVDAADIEQAQASLLRGGLMGGSDAEAEGSSFLAPSLNRSETEFAQARRLEKSLARRLKQLDFIEYASVTITPAVTRYFRKGRQEAKATVQVKPIGLLSREQVKSIAHSVAGGVQKLSADAVAIVDASTGIVLKSPESSGASTSNHTPDLAYQMELERQKEMKVQTRLDLVYGPRRVVVSVSAEIDWERAETEAITYDPEGGVIIEKDLEDSTESGGGGRSGGATGTAAIARGAAGGSGKDIKSKTLHEKRLVASTKEATVKLGGTLTRLSIGVFVDESLASEVDSIEKTIRAAVGINEKRGDVVQIHTTAFSALSEPLAQPEESEAGPTMIYAWVEYGLYGLLGLAFCVFALRTIRNARSSLTEVLRTSMEDDEGPDTDRNGEEEIIAAIGEDLDLAGRSLKRWLYDTTPVS